MKIPKDFPVQPLKEGENVIGRATCGVCGLSWDDAKATEWTPAPSGRCPFEYFHEPQEGAGEEPPATFATELASSAGWTVEDAEEFLKDVLAPHEAEVRRLQAIIDGQKQVIDNLMERNQQLQKLVLSYQQDNAVDYEAKDEVWSRHD